MDRVGRKGRKEVELILTVGRSWQVDFDCFQKF
jgi:hypothetical protein